MPANTNDVDSYVGSRLRLARILAQISLEDLADRTGISEFELFRMERGELRASADRLFSLSEKLEQPVAFFYAGLS